MTKITGPTTPINRDEIVKAMQDVLRDHADPHEIATIFRLFMGPDKVTTLVINDALPAQLDARQIAILMAGVSVLAKAHGIEDQVALAFGRGNKELGN